MSVNSTTGSGAAMAAAEAAKEAAAQAKAASIDAKAEAAAAAQDTKTAGKSTFESIKETAAAKIDELKDKAGNIAAKHNVDIGAIAGKAADKAKDLTASGLEGISNLAEKLSGAAHNASAKMSHKD